MAEHSSAIAIGEILFSIVFVLRWSLPSAAAACAAHSRNFA
jgi:hypothetical protein